MSDYVVSVTDEQVMLPLGAPATASASRPLPVSIVTRPSGAQPLAGVSVGAALVGPYTPPLGRPFYLRLLGAAGGVAQLLRSYDGNQAHAKPITALGNVIYSGLTDCQEQVSPETEAGATYWISLSEAGIDYRLSH